MVGGERSFLDGDFDEFAIGGETGPEFKCVLVVVLHNFGDGEVLLVVLEGDGVLLSEGGVLWGGGRGQGS